MTGLEQTPAVPERKLVAEQFMACRTLAESLASSIRRLGQDFPMTGTALAALDESGKDRLDAFIHRFALLQDLVGAKLFRGVLIMDLESVPVAMIDIVAAMEKRGLIDSVESWHTLRQIRNDLAHSYRDAPDDAAANLNEALVRAPYLIAVLERVREYLVRRNVVELDGITPVPLPPSPDPSSHQA